MRMQAAGKGDMFIGACSQCDGNTVRGVLLGDAASVFFDRRKVSLYGGIGIGNCGHKTTIIGGSHGTNAERLRVAYKGTAVANVISGRIISGSSTVSIGG